MKKNFYARRYLLNILDYNDKIYFYDSLEHSKSINPKIMNYSDKINLCNEKLNGISRISKIFVRLFNNFDKTFFEFKIFDKKFVYEIENNLSIAPFQFIIEPKIYDDDNHELEYQLLISIVPSPNVSKITWIDIADNIEQCICEIRCNEIIFNHSSKNYLILSNIGIDKNLVPRNKLNYGFVLYGNTYSELFLWTIISYLKDD
jgi:hypothetical protein